MTKTMSREDIHRPSAPEFDPADYVLYGCGDNGTTNERPFHVNTVELNRQGWSAFQADRQHCTHCGSFLRYYAIMLHEKTMQYIVVGETCLDGRFELSKAEFQAMRKASALNREAAAKRARVAAQTTPELTKLAETFADADGFLGEIAAKVGKTEMSDRQIAAFIRVGNKRIADNAVRAEAEAVRTATATPVPQVDGKITVKGTIKSIKTEDNRFGPGTVTRMLVESVDGYRVYGTLAAFLGDVVVGDAVEFPAFVTRSDRDPLFGFFGFRKPKK